MSNKQSLVFLNQVKPFKDTWQVHVKCLHSCKINNNSGESLECVLMDEQVSLILYIYIYILSLICNTLSILLFILAKNINISFYIVFRVRNFMLLPKEIRCIVYSATFLLVNGGLLRTLQLRVLEVNIE